ncbi:MAG TPA: hypothetical protein VMR50_00905 [Myxococcota bacterium]|nr:hypothetical protein [Myxococcota bacterium]
MILRYTLIVSILLLGSATELPAAPPSIFAYQSQLLASTGLPQAGTANFVVGLYSAASGGSLLYQETQSGVALSNGTFSLFIGTGTSSSGSIASATTGPNVWLQLTVNGEVLSPREQLASAAFTLSASNATLLTTPTGLQTVSQVAASAKGATGPAGPTGPAGARGSGTTFYATCAPAIQFGGLFVECDAVQCNCGSGALILRAFGQCSTTSPYGSCNTGQGVCTPTGGGVVQGSCCECQAN